MSDDDSDQVFHGAIEDVIARIVEAVTEGRMTQEQATELITILAHQNKKLQRHDVSVGFRVGLIAQGYEEMALRLKEVWMTLTQAGAMFEYGLEADFDADWMDHLDAAANAAMLQASVWVLRAGNINARADEDGRIRIEGPIVDEGNGVAPDDVEALVNEFVKELDIEFPDTPPPRKGQWW